MKHFLGVIREEKMYAKIFLGNQSEKICRKLFLVSDLLIKFTIFLTTAKSFNTITGHIVIKLYASRHAHACSTDPHASFDV